MFLLVPYLPAAKKRKMLKSVMLFCVFRFRPIVLRILCLFSAILICDTSSS